MKLYIIVLTLPITPETGQDVVENVLFVAKVEEHGDE